MIRAALLLGVLGLLAPAASAPACGCGALIPAEPGAGASATEWSLVAFDGEREEITMRLSLGQPLDESALVLPVRPGASVAHGDDEAFERLAALTAPRVEQRKRYHLGFADGGGGALDGAGAVGGAPGGVDVLRTQELGPLEVVTLRSRSTAALEAWLRDNDFPVPGGLAAATQDYLDDGWDLVVAKLRPQAAGIPAVELQPLAIDFPTDRPVYPLRLSRLAESGSSARVDLVAPWKAAVTGQDATLLFAGRVSGAVLGPLQQDGILTSFRFAIGPASPDRDPVFARADDQAPFRQVRVVYDDVYLGGIVVPAAVLVLALGAAALLVARRRRA